MLFALVNGACRSFACKYFTNLLGTQQFVSVRSVCTANNSAVKLSFLCTQVDCSNLKNPLLVYHGLLGSKLNWRVLSQKLAEETSRNAYTFDVRDHGDSPHTGNLTYDAMVNDLISFMDEMNFQKAVLIGHSLGGRAMIQFAMDFPARVEKLVIVDIGIKTVRTDKQSSILNVDLVKTMQKAIDSVSPELSLSQTRREVDEYLRQTIPDEFIRAFLLLNLKKQDNKNSWKYNLTAVKKLLRSDSINNLRLSKPFYGQVLLIHGGKSEYVKKTDYESILNWFPNCRFECIAEGNHYLHIQCQREFLDKVRMFLNSAN